MPSAIHQQALASYVRSPAGRELVEAAAGGDTAAARRVAKETGVTAIDVIAWAQDLFDAGGAPKVTNDDVTTLSGGLGKPVAAGGTVAHLTGFRGASLDGPQANPASVPDQPAVASALAAVLGGLDVELLAAPVREQVLAFLDAAGTDAPKTAADVQAVYAKAAEAIGEDTVRDAVGKLAVSVNDFAQGQGEVKTFAWRQVADRLNWDRVWGLSLLPPDDAAFRDPDYLLALNQESGQITSTFQNRQTRSKAKKRFEAAFRDLAPTFRPFAYADSGSDAVSLCFDIARSAGRRRLGIKDHTQDHRDWGVAFFDGSYGGGRGLSAGMNYTPHVSENRPNLEHHRLPDCSTTSMEPTDPEETKRLDTVEQEAIGKLRQMAEDPDRPIGAIMLEPVLGKGAKVYRRSFVQQLRELATELKLPFICDEVLTSGGRTGKFFAHEHYDVQPDYVTFGKGMQVNGIAHHNRAHFAQHGLFGVTTSDSDAVRLLKGAAFLERVRDDDLIPKSAEAGAHLLARLQEVDPEGHPPSTGLGLLISTSVELQSVASSASEKRRVRMMPPLTLTIDDVDEALAALDPAKGDGS